MAKIRATLADTENPEWTTEDFKRAKRLEDIPALASLSRKRGERGPQKTPTKQQVTLRLDRDVLDRFRSTGPGWQSRINAVLRRAKVG